MNNNNICNLFKYYSLLIMGLSRSYKDGSLRKQPQIYDSIKDMIIDVWQKLMVI